MLNFWETNRILLVLTGSRAYGTSTPTSDTDTRGICIPTQNHLLGLDKFELHEDKVNDEVIYSLQKFLGMCLSSNPNSFEILFSDKKCILEQTQAGESLQEIRHAFLSKQLFYSYSGYAKSEFKALKRNATGDRKALIDQFGYDVKSAYHVIRLIDTADEALTTGEVTVERPNADFLLSIRRGEIPYEDFEKIVEERKTKLEKSFDDTKLPENPNRDFVNSWLTQTHKTFLVEGKF